MSRLEVGHTAGWDSQAAQNWRQRQSEINFIPKTSNLKDIRNWYQLVPIPLQYLVGTQRVKNTLLKTDFNKVNFFSHK